MANPKPEELARIDYKPPKTGWMDTPTVFKPGIFPMAASKNPLKPSASRIRGNGP